MTEQLPPLLKSITLQGFLSFGPDAVTTPLTGLNVIIGPNGSGKSNFIEAISVLRAAGKDLPLPIRRGGGVRDWLWKDADGKEGDKAMIEAIFAAGRVAHHPPHDPAVRYRLVFGAEGSSFTVLDERIENEHPAAGATKPYFYFGYEAGRPMLNVHSDQRELRREDLDPTQSILTQRRDPDAYPEITRLAELLRRILIYRSWQLGPDSDLRASCRPDVPTNHLSEDFDNLPARLAVLKRAPAVKQRLIQLLADLAPGFDDIEIVPEGGRLQLYLDEHGRMFPASRLSDGSLRFLCLLAILLDPTPPPLVAIEEPELGLHPDVLPTLCELMVAAAESCQLVVTTHSTQLVDALTDQADSVLICEKPSYTTSLTRLTRQEVERWREHGSLGSLWMSGHLGGTRW